MATNESVGWFFIKKLFPNKINQFDTIKKPIGHNDLRIMISRTYPNAAAITEKFNAALQRIKSNGVLTAIMKKNAVSE